MNNVVNISAGLKIRENKKLKRLQQLGYSRASVDEDGSSQPAKFCYECDESYTTLVDHPMFYERGSREDYWQCVHCAHYENFEENHHEAK